MGSVLSQVLTKEHIEAGLYIECDGRNFYLKQQDGQVLKTFPLGVRVVEVRHAANQELEWAKSGIGCRRGNW